MRRKRLQHTADNLCQMFCGWRLINCKPELVKLGSGQIEIDAITGDCQFNGQSIPSLSIAYELQQWVRDDFERNHIRIDDIKYAKLTADLSFCEIGWSERSGKDQFFDSDRQVKTAKMHRCQIRCSSEVSTNETLYTSNYNDLEEWPIGWPAA